MLKKILSVNKNAFVSSTRMDPFRLREFSSLFLRHKSKQPPHESFRSSAEEWIKTSDRPITKLQCSEIREHRHSINTERNRLQVDRFIDRRNQLMESKLNLILCRRSSTMSFITNAETAKQIQNSRDTFFSERYYTTKASSISANIESKDSQEKKTSKVNEFTYRTHTCGELTELDEGKNVTLCGWLEYSRMKKFFTLRDGYGQVQILVPDELAESIDVTKFNFETILQIDGEVILRPPKMVNPKMKTGTIEVKMNNLKVLNSSKEDLPFHVRKFNRANEPLRMQYRYIDLRFADMQKNLRIRSQVFMKMREYLINLADFVEVETPTLFRRTPGGAQEFVVPTQKAGQFYSLVQSPQQFKQMLMAGAIDRYFQIARCYRDETTTPNRQPEFTQLDIELSFTKSNDVMKLIENILMYSWPKELKTFSLPFPRMTFDNAMEQYGSDKPDTRTNAFLLNNVTDAMKDTNDSLSNFAAYAIILQNRFAVYPNTLKKRLQEIASKHDVRFFMSKISKDVDSWIESGVGNLGIKTTKQLSQILNLKEKDTVLLAYGKKTNAQNLLGKIRLELIEHYSTNDKLIQIPENQLNFLWIENFPLFTWNDETNELETTHHPFTAPHPDDLHHLDNSENYTKCRSLAYDLVLNGQEVGGGSIRIHDAKLQQRILKDILHLETSHLTHLIEALESGCPPHGGIALGLDRLLSIICKTNSIRDVIAFPKSFEGKDLLSKAPCPITKEELDLYHLKIKP